jgi:hypothetical protein
MAKTMEDDKSVEKHGELFLASVGVKFMRAVPISVQMSSFEIYEALLHAGAPIQKLARKSFKRASSNSRLRPS